MADINAELLRALNGPAPQHKKADEQAFEFTEGEQGKLFTGNHVMTDSGLWIPQKGSDDGAAHTQVTGSKVETYASDRGGFSIEVLPGSVYYANIEFEKGVISGANGGDMRNYKKIAVGVQRDSEHNYRLEVRSKAFDTTLSINQIETVDGSNLVKLIDMELNFHQSSIRIYNDSEEPQNYQLAVSAFKFH